MIDKGWGTKIFASKGDGTEWEYTIDENGTRIGHMVGTTADREKALGKVYSAQTGKWSYPDE
jgi:hypothetical protein